MRLKKKNLLILLSVFLIINVITFYVQFLPYFKIHSKTYFHERMVNEIVESSKRIEIPTDFIVKEEDRIRVNTMALNRWLIEVNTYLNQNIQKKMDANIPLGYFTGIVFIQNKGPVIPVSYLMNQRLLARYDIKTTSLGINNVLIELILQVECKGHVFLGFDSMEMEITEAIPLALEYVQGEVPQIFPYEKGA